MTLLMHCVHDAHTFSIFTNCPLKLVDINAMSPFGLEQIPWPPSSGWMGSATADNHASFPFGWIFRDVATQLR